MKAAVSTSLAVLVLGALGGFGAASLSLVSPDAALTYFQTHDVVPDWLGV